MRHLTSGLNRKSPFQALHSKVLAVSGKDSDFHYPCACTPRLPPAPDLARWAYPRPLFACNTALLSGCNIAKFPGNIEAGELGLAAVPGRQDEFRTGLNEAVRIHIMAGRVPLGLERQNIEEEMEETFIENLQYAADILAQAGMVGLLEPINSLISEPRYFLNTPQHAASILQKVKRPNLKLQMDLYHWQIMGGNLTQNIKTYFPLIGHVQIAQVPHRNEPDSPGELNFMYLFDLLQELGYQGYVGCEYKPQGDTAKGLGWMKKYLKYCHVDNKTN
ncbi:putative hydroxypyruvate isomerase isoform X2 [Xenopus tropicalis]|uniref:Hydroxypyruvate isomerase isoform X2 n=1 Tax=Xenopus tropicalis TaxID=8364 RepID=A0A8J1JCR1_XENTR|nr:putative hydroxypyruvate isomerase isoform X2 [Xenopus tropicalis]